MNDDTRSTHFSLILCEAKANFFFRIYVLGEVQLCQKIFRIVRHPGLVARSQNVTLAWFKLGSKKNDIRRHKSIEPTIKDNQTTV